MVATLENFSSHLSPFRGNIIQKILNGPIHTKLLYDMHPKCGKLTIQLLFISIPPYKMSLKEPKVLKDLLKDFWIRAS